MVREGFKCRGHRLHEAHRNRHTKWEDGNVWENRGSGWSSCKPMDARDSWWWSESAMSPTGSCSDFLSLAGSAIWEGVSSWRLYSTPIPGSGTFYDPWSITMWMVSASWSGHHELNCSTILPCHDRQSPLKPWARLNTSSWKLLLSDIWLKWRRSN